MNQLIVRKQKTEPVAPEELQQYLTFLIGKDSLGINIMDVKEIIEINTITRIPLTPSYIRGVINLRGSVVPVIDLAARLGREPGEITKRSCIVLVQINYQDETQLLGMLVDAVAEIIELPETAILPPPDFGADMRLDFIQAMGRVGEEFLILLNINRVLALKELSELKMLTERFDAAE